MPHTLGGIHAYRSTDTTEEDPRRVDLIRRPSTAFLRQALGIDGAGWRTVNTELATATEPAGHIQTK